MYLISVNDLVKGDILLTSESSATSKVVRKSTGSDFSHAILYVGSGSYIHSDSEGVRAGNIQRLLFENAENITVLRVDCSTEIINNACLFARSKIGTKYSIKDAIRVKLKIIKKDNENRQFCSRLVAQSYDYAGLKLVENPSFCTPQDIFKSEYIRKVSVKVRKANENEIAFANSENPLKRQEDITKKILCDLRSLTQRDIQTLEQITEFVILNPNYDGVISKIFNDSGYFTLWVYEVTKNPWRYNGEIFLSLPGDKNKLSTVAESEIKWAHDRLEVYNRNLKQYDSLNKIHKLEYLKLHFDLYEQMVSNTMANILAAQHVLDNI
ncbi:hypothetical protein M2371_001968 [Buttiauxella sp. BIGb0471]|uniref:YiiX/YebB-like N1pC/P60 family cysteine hydrolase n=1 Tax=Buttiauxella sp. BIGb0471 TaxID=2940597 RepID=UPI0021688851|nr:YiiX/YebB-like N1pC/P60 family cysteine hydrolase [Buttiauxella sp. BIGb0471]MCS3602759.1 hypothetical protein [Buttiauxella sp. BIGb0471]